MKSEASLSRDLFGALRGVPGSVVLKINDRTTAGIPDGTFSYGGTTSWIEVKLGRNPKYPRVQLETMMSLQKATHTAFYVIFTEGESGLLVALIIYPSVLEDFVADNLGKRRGFICRNHVLASFDQGRLGHTLMPEVALWFKEQHRARRT